MRRVLEWNGRDLPAVLRELSPSRYCIDDDRRARLEKAQKAKRPWNAPPSPRSTGWRTSPSAS